MKIIKRDGSKQAFAPNKILNRIKRVAKGLNVSSDKIFQKVIPLIKDGMTATDIDEIIAFQAADLQIEHPDYAVLGGRILISRQAKLLEVEEKPVDEQFDSFAASTFLKKYSLKNEKGIPVEIPSMMYNRVANHLYTDSFKERRNLLNELYEKKINFATPILSNSGIEGRNGLISCFDKDTKIVTDSGLKKISEIKVGDNVLTHKNRFMPVNEVYKNEMVNRGVKLVKIYRTEAIKCTDNHEFLSYTSEDERLGLSPSFKPIKWLRVGDYIKGAFLNDNNKSQNIIIDLLDYKDYITDNWEKFKATKDTKIKSIDIKLIEGDKIQIISVFEKKDGRLVTKEGSIINRYWNIDEDFCKFLGIFYGDGHIQRSSKNGPQGIGFTTKEISPNVVNFITEYGTKILGIEPKIYTQKFGDRSWNKIMFASKMVCVIWEHLFGLGYGGKHVPYFINSLSKKEVDNLIAGLISSDGNVTKKGQIRVSMANENIITNINSIGRRNGYTTGVSVARNRQGTPMYRIDFGNDTELLKLISKDYSDDRMSIIKTQLNKTHIKIINGEYYYRINDINDVIDYNEKYVYDLNVEEDHSYSVENVVVHNCNLTMLKSDSIEGINETLDKISQGSKEGSGIGLNIDPIRSSRSLVSSFKGYAGGVVRFADMVQSHMRFYKQGNRSGSCALYLSTWHRDILEFLELRLPIGEELNRARDLFTAVSIDDVFMEALINETDYYLFCPNDIKKAGLKALHEVHGEEFREIYNKAVELGIGYKTEPKKIWDAIIRSQVESGTPYVFYKDNANKRNMQDNIGVISQSNLCMTGDQRVVTDKGYLTVKELYESGEKLNLFNGHKLVKSSEMKLRAKNEDVYKITLENGIEHKVTSYHGIPILDNKNNITRVECKDLKIGDKVAIQTKKGLFGTRNLVKEAYLLGHYQSDGTQNQSSIMFDLWENDFDLVDVIEANVQDLHEKYGHKPRYSNKGGYFVNGHDTIGGVKKKRLTSTFFKEFGFKKGSVPNWIWESDEETQWAYIKGLLEADGTISLSQYKGNPIHLSYTDINKEFLKELQLLFNNLGLQSSIHNLHKGGKRLLPDGKGGEKLYNCKDSYRLVVGSKNSVLEIERNTGFLTRKKVILEDRKYRDNSKKSSKVLSIEYIGKEDVYCPTVYNDENIFIAQGMKTFNCIEILQASKPGYTPQCTLASVNLAEHDNIKTITKSTKVLVRALNQVINKNKWSDEWSKNAGEDQRAIAIGVAGLADFFAKKKISFESEEAKEWTEKIFEAMYKAAVTESMNLAIEEGSNYPAWEGSRYSKGETYIEGWSPAPKGEPIPMKNSLLLGLMPTASSAILLGAFECFEPITSNVFTRMVGDGEFIVVNKYLVNELNELGLWNEDIRNKIIANEGSVQDIQEIPEDIRYRYKTIWEIPQKALLDLSIIRNKYVDQSQSLNVYHADAKYSKISSALVYAWKNGLKTGAYYTRTKSKLGSNKKLSASDNVDNKQVLPKRPENSMFTCAGGGCDS